MMFLFDNVCKVVNKTKEPYDVYIGRGTPFGNPFVIGIHGDRDEVIEKYREHFTDKIKTDIRFRNQVRQLNSKVLGCHCKPKPCHGDVIKEYIERL